MSRKYIFVEGVRSFWSLQHIIVPCHTAQVGNHVTVNSKFIRITRDSEDTHPQVASSLHCHHHQLISISGIQTTTVPSLPPEVTYGFVGMPPPSESATSVTLHPGNPFYPQHPTGSRAEKSGPNAQKRGEGKWGVQMTLPTRAGDTQMLITH